MSKDPIDKWLDALQFENYRLQFTPNHIHVKVLQSQIQQLESQPVDEIDGNDLEATLQRLGTLKQDLASVQQLMDLATELRKLRDEMREKGLFLSPPVETDDVLDAMHAFLEVKKYEQRARQWRNLDSLRHLWPKADGPRRRRIAELLTTYSRRRFTWGMLNLKLGTPLRIARWAIRMYKKY